MDKKKNKTISSHPFPPPDESVLDNLDLSDIQRIWVVHYMWQKYYDDALIYLDIRWNRIERNLFVLVCMVILGFIISLFL